MKILTKYTMREILGPFGAGVLFFTFVFVVQLLPEIFNLIIQNDVSPVQAFEIFMYTLPFNIGFITPMSVLMATIMGFGRLSSDNEIIAMRALGANHLRIYKPVFVFGLIIFIACFFFNNFIMTESNYRYRALIGYLVNIRPSIALKEMEFANIPEVNISISAREVTSTNMYNVVIYDKGKDNAPRRIITSETGRWINNKANSGLITLQLSNGIVQEVIDGGIVSNDFNIFESLNINILRDVQTKIGGHSRGLRESSSLVIFKKMKNFRSAASDNYKIELINKIDFTYKTTTNEMISNINIEYISQTNELISTINTKYINQTNELIGTINTEYINQTNELIGNINTEYINQTNELISTINTEYINQTNELIGNINTEYINQTNELISTINTEYINQTNELISTINTEYINQTNELIGNINTEYINQTNELISTINTEYINQTNEIISNINTEYISQTNAVISLSTYSNELINNINNNYISKTNAIIPLSTYSNNYIVENKKEIKQERKKILQESIPRYYYIEFNKFISIPAACLFIVLIGAPLGIIGKRTGKGLGFGISVLVVVVYYFIITASEMVASSNKNINPNLAMWIPNICLFTFGSFFIIRSLFLKGK